MNINEMSDLQLQRVIAELLGWTKLRERPHYYHPERLELIGHNSVEINPDYEVIIPCWPIDTNSALELLKQMPGYTLDWWAADKEWWIVECDMDGYKTLASSPTASRAISEAFAAMKEAEAADA